MVSLIPFFIIAGFLESYVTRHYLSIPDPVKLVLILLCFGIMILYYVVYPFFVAKKFPDKIELKEVPRYIPEKKLDWNIIRNAGEVFTDTFYVFIAKASRLSRIFMSVVLPFILVLTILIYILEANRFNFVSLSWNENMGS